MTVVGLKALAKESGLRGYSKLRKAEFIAFLWNNLQQTPVLWPTPRPLPRHPNRPPPPPPISVPQSVRLRPDRPEPELLREFFEEIQRQPTTWEADRPRQPASWRPERPRQLEERYPQLVRPRPLQNPKLVRPRQPPTLKLYQLKPKRGKIEPPVEQTEVPPPSNAKQIKRMKKK